MFWSVEDKPIVTSCLKVSDNPVFIVFNEKWVSEEYGSLENVLIENPRKRWPLCVFGNKQIGWVLNVEFVE